MLLAQRQFIQPLNNEKPIKDFVRFALLPLVYWICDDDKLLCGWPCQNCRSLRSQCLSVNQSLMENPINPLGWVLTRVNLLLNEICTNLPYELVQDYAQFSVQSTIIAAYEPSILWNLKNAKLFCWELFKQVIVWKLQMSICNLPWRQWKNGTSGLVDPAQNQKVSSCTVLHRSSDDMPNLYQQITNYLSHYLTSLSPHQWHQGAECRFDGGGCFSLCRVLGGMVSNIKESLCWKWQEWQNRSMTFSFFLQ